MRTLRFWAIGLLFFAAIDLLWAGAFAAETRRAALVIGNSKYVNAMPLPNPANDAQLIASTLHDAGFHVIEGIDQDIVGMRNLISRFAEESYHTDLAVIFYAGHGMQVDGKNYLIPIDAELTSPAFLKTRTVQVDEFIAALPPDPAVGVIILDACRDNPLVRSLATALPKSRSLGAGLAPVEAKADGVGTGGVLIAYATDPGAIAFDGDGVNSPYSLALAKHLTEPGVEIQSALTRVRGDVTRATQGRQRPWHNASLGREIFLGKPPEQTPQSDVDEAPAERRSTDGRGWEVEQRVWDEASKRNELAYYEAYMQQFPDGAFTDLARLNIGRLRQPKGDTVAMAAPKGESLSPSSALADAPEVGTAISESMLGLDKRGRVDLQLRLQVLGYDVGDITDAFGPKTRQAIGDWQRSQGMPPSTFFTLKQRSRLIAETQALMEAAHPKATTKKAKASNPPPAPRTVARAAKPEQPAAPTKTARKIKPPPPVPTVEAQDSRRKYCKTTGGKIPSNPAPGFHPACGGRDTRF